MTHGEFISRLKSEYPKAAKEAEPFGGFEKLVIPTLIAPEAIRLPCTLRDEAQRLVSLFHNRIRENPDEAQRLRSILPVLKDPGHYSVLMSYDFHIDPTGALRLIEINTNASVATLVDVMNAARGLERARTALLQDFAAELKRPLAGAQIAIVDDEPTSQKLFVEFLLYKELLEAAGASVVIADRRDVRLEKDNTWAGHFGPVDFIYNRSTDFYFEEPASRGLKDILDARAAVISPSPHEYRLLADKNRMVRWSQTSALKEIGLNDGEIAVLNRTLIPTREISGLDPEKLWDERKKLIFKPKNAFGGKAVFRGGSVSRGMFQNILAGDGLAQEFVPAPVITIDGHEFKYDLRFFAYRDQVRLACARLYRGQMTNATTSGGGVTSVIWQ